MKRHEVKKPSVWFFVLVWPWLKLISLLPFFVLYRISDFISFLLYRVLKYRIHVVRDNLKRCFKSKSQQEIQLIEKQFYQHLGDLFVETIKGLSISSDAMKKRMLNLDQHIYDELNKNNKNSIIVMSHCGNWEWICLMSQLACKQQIQCIYKTLSNPGFDYLMFTIRSKFGANPVPMEQTLRVFSSNKDLVTCNAFIGDQNPSSGSSAAWVDFFGIETAFMWGTEKIAKKFNWPVYYLSSYKVKRGYYQATTVPLCLNPADTDEGYITQQIALHTQKEIEAQPYAWLWSHKRWKHNKA